MKKNTRNMVCPAVALLIGLQLLIVVVVALSLTFEVRRMRATVLQANQTQLVSQAQNAEIHLSQSFNLLQQHLLALPFADAPPIYGHNDVLSSSQSEHPALDSEALEQLKRPLNDILSKLVYIRSLSVLDDNGLVVYSTHTPNIGGSISLRQFLPINAHGTPGVLLFGSAWQGRDFADGMPLVNASQRDESDSTFFPVAMTLSNKPRINIVAAVNSDYFVRFGVGAITVDGLDTGAYLDDGFSLFSSATPPLTALEYKRLPEANARAAAYKGQLDGDLVAYQPSKVYPWFVFSQAPVKAVLYDWRHSTHQLLLTAALLMVLMLLLTGYLTRRVYTLLRDQKQLFEQTAQLASVFTYSSDGIAITDPSMEIIAINPAFETITGYDKQDVLGRQPATWVSSFRDEALYNELTTELREHGVWQKVITERRKDGRLLILRLTISVVPHPLDPEHLFYVGVLTDITASRESEQRIRTLSQAIEQSPSSVLITDTQGRIVYANPESISSTGYSANELLGKNASIFSSGLTPHSVYKELWQTISQGNTWRGEFQNRRKDGSVYVERALISPLTDEDGAITSYLGIKEDISHEKEVESQLKLAASVMSSTIEGVAIYDADRRIIDVNPAFTKITGYSREEALGTTPELLSSGRHDQTFYDSLFQALDTRGYWHGEFWNRTKQGELFAALSNISVVHDEDGSISHYINVFDDITELRSHQERLELLAHFDPLTRLPNRTLLQDRLHVEVGRSKRDGTSLAVCFMDLDHFKEVNDAHGHEAGDELLRVIARRLQEGVRGGDTAARLGGDEFVLLLAGLKKEAEYEDIAQRILEAVALPVHLSNGHTVGVSGSMGITLYPSDQSEVEQLLRNADYAMYQAKQQGRNRYILYDPEADEAHQALIRSKEAVIEAIDNNDFILYYQPQLDLRTRAVVGFEALLRWQHAERGLLEPARFLPAAIEAGVATAIDLWVVRQAFYQLSQWRENAVLVGSLSINISASTIGDQQFVEHLKTLLNEFPTLHARTIEFEVLESSAIRSLSDAHETLQRVRDLGFRLALDDFGTGYSSLALLRHLPVSTLKIDQSFVQNMFTSRSDLSLIESVIRLARAFQLDLIAEGVESIAQGEALLSLGCSTIQGFSVSPPMPVTEVSDWLDNFFAGHHVYLGQRPVQASVEPSIAAVSLHHRLWLSRIEEFVADFNQDDEVSLDLDIDQCAFGEWLHWAKRETTVANQVGFDQIVMLHEDIHAAAAHIVSLVKHDKHKEARKQMERLYTMQSQFLYELNSLQMPTIHSG
ncbi:MAG TPA: EAL domain-containing protein [Burkholderiaceae bacterium]|nr:EAL domain-containing protein [Burkholderiaceae bacterium]